MNPLKIFVSSTCYDLSQIRADLHDFIYSLGYHPTLSESNSFPIDPDNDTLENCIENVRSSDVFILILGNRYGYVTENGKSITNTEYLYAKERGIPIYIFIYKPLTTILPIWKNNKNIDLTGIIESPKVFEFVELLRETNKNWCFEFEKAQDITGTLKVQLSHLFKSSLELRKKYRMSNQPDYHRFLSANALNLILLKEEGFELLFFAEVLDYELNKYESLRLDIEYEIILKCSKNIDDISELFPWLNINFSSSMHLINSMNNLFGDAFYKYWGAPGTPADLKGLYYVACSIAKIFKELITWSVDIKSTRVNDDFLLVRDTLSSFVKLAIEKIWSYPNLIRSKYKEGRDEYLMNGNPLEVQITLVLEIDPTLVSSFTLEMERLGAKYK